MKNLKKLFRCFVVLYINQCSSEPHTSRVGGKCISLSNETFIVITENLHVAVVIPL